MITVRDAGRRPNSFIRRYMLFLLAGQAYSTSQWVTLRP
jgi:hypothetical protein